MVALFAVTKTGAAFLLIDPDWPGIRIDTILDEAKPSHLLVHQATARRIRAGTHIVRVDEPRPVRSRTRSRIDIDSPGYVVFTSGSTGKPKGALNTHRGLCNRLLWMQAQYFLGQADFVVQKTPVGFDVCIWEFFWPLMAGARLLVAKPGGHLDPDYLLALIQRFGITVIHFVPTMLRIFIEHLDVSERLPSIRRIICSGEPLPRDLHDCVIRRFAAKLSNLYGPAEAAIDVTAWECSMKDGLGVVPIGRAIANCQVYVLDIGMHPVAIGIPGEIFIGGENVGLGYLNRPQLTSERFVPDPFNADNGRARLYRTGDIGRYLPDGNIAFIGRQDDQVKVNGQRIELGEVASACRSHPKINDAAVLLKDGKLFAYVTPSDSTMVLPAKEVRAWLSQRLTKASVPSVLVIPAMPLNANGKVDHAALPELVPDLSEMEFVAPSTPTERLLATAWSSVLRRERIGIDDNFFDLGGDALAERHRRVVPWRLAVVAVV